MKGRQDLYREQNKHLTKQFYEKPTPRFISKKMFICFYQKNLYKKFKQAFFFNSPKIIESLHVYQDSQQLMSY